MLWCRSHLVRLVFERSISTCACFHSENFLTCYTLRLVTISKMHCPSNCKTSTVGLSPSPAVIRAEPIVLNILMCQYMSRQDWSQQRKERVYPPTLFPHLTDGEKECTPHSFSPPYRWGERVYPSLFSPTLQMGKNSVPPTLSPHLTDGEKEWTTLFFPFSTVEI